jgi:hypothetical protein
MEVVRNELPVERYCPVHSFLRSPANIIGRQRATMEYRSTLVEEVSVVGNQSDYMS